VKKNERETSFETKMRERRRRRRRKKREKRRKKSIKSQTGGKKNPTFCS